MKKKILVVNGPNLNLLGRREPEIYGHKTLDDINSELVRSYEDVDFEFFQSNHEGELIDKIQQAGFDDTDVYAGIILNAGGLTHTSVALADAVGAIPVEVVEVHISNIYKREEFRRRSLLSAVCKGTVTGFGTVVYRLGVEALLHSNND